MPSRRVVVGRVRGTRVVSRHGGKLPQKGSTAGGSTTRAEVRKILAARARKARKKK